ncbi:hypothetical protein [Marinobacter mobilis]|uniref:DUF4878 domain-containing protein n=1 Tax=Marinobacter mobilis TaxID=488533 RepID=A0A1H2ZDP2_9GAMM|nr:hypothetical protein [Marinobacter mobilis]SDX15486.1 hypothetical protein SAMN04487960_106285 [Marinobacter mobilis]
MMARAVKLAGALMAAALLTGCSDTPSNGDIEDALNALNPQSFTEVTDFEKVNGYAEGEHRYVVEVNYEITFTQGMNELMAEASGMEKMALAMLKMAVGDFEEGDTMEDTTSLTFVDSENGWQPL